MIAEVPRISTVSPVTDGVNKTCVSSNAALALTDIPSALVAAWAKGEELAVAVVLVGIGVGVVVTKIGGGGGGGGAGSTDN